MLPRTLPVATLAAAFGAFVFACGGTGTEETLPAVVPDAPSSTDAPPAMADAVADTPSDARPSETSTPEAGAGSKLGKLAEGWAANEWHELPGAPLASVLLTHAEADAIDPGIWQVSGSSSAITIWASGAFDGRRLYVGSAGGHGGYNGNEMYAYDFQTLSWSRLYDPSPLAACAGSGSGTDCRAVWGPQASHHYDALVHSKKTDSLFFMNWGRCWVWRLSEPDPKRGWKEFACATNMSGQYPATAEDPKTGAIVVFSGGSSGLAALDPETLTWSRLTGKDSVYGTYQVLDVDPVRRKAFFMGAWTGGPHYEHANVTAIDLDGDPLAVASASESEPPKELHNSCFLHHPRSGKMIAWNGDERLWSYDPDADRWTSVTTTGVKPTSSSTNGVFQKCAYLADVDLFVGYNDERRGMFAIRASL